MADQHQRRARGFERPPPAIRSSADRDGWSARRAAGCRARRRARGRAPHGALRRRRAFAGSSAPVRPSSPMTCARGAHRASGRARPRHRRARSQAGEVRLLRQVAQAVAGLDEASAAIRLQRAGGDPKQGRFARSVAPDEADFLAAPIDSSAASISGLPPSVSAMFCSSRRGGGIRAWVSPVARARSSSLAWLRHVLLRHLLAAPRFLGLYIGVA